MGHVLSDEQVGFFRRHGYLTPLRAIAETAAADCRRRLESYESETGAPAFETLHIKPHLYFSWSWELTRSAAITGALRDLIGPDVLVLASRFWIKEPGDGAFVTWHQDTAYFGLEPPEMITLWIALTEAGPDNGGMRFLPGSHRGRARRHVETEDPRNLLSRGQRVEDVDETGAVDVVLRPGEFSIHHGQTLHDSAANESSDRRIGFGLMAMPTRVRSTTGRRSATLLCGDDAYGHWELDPEPAGDRDPVIWDLMHQADTGYRDRSIRQEADTAD